VWAAAKLPAYVYRLNTLTTSLLPNFAFGVYHTSEIAFVFHNVRGIGYSTGDPFAGQPSSYIALADLMSRAWIGEMRWIVETSTLLTDCQTGFIAKTDPNSVSGVTWPEYGATTENLVFHPNGSYPEPDDFRAKQLAFINSIPEAYMR